MVEIIVTTMIILETRINMILDIIPVAKPRMTKSDKWKKRQSVLKFFAFRDAVRQEILKGTELDFIPYDIEFHIQTPKSWSKIKKKEQWGKPHLSRPDLDNFVKAWNDSVFEEDSLVWQFRATKIWTGNPGYIAVYPLDTNPVSWPSQQRAVDKVDIMWQKARF